MYWCLSSGKKVLKNQSTVQLSYIIKVYCFCQRNICFLYAPVLYTMWEKLMECSLAPFSSDCIMAVGICSISHAVLPCEKSWWSAPWLHSVVSIMADGICSISHAVLPCEKSWWSAPWLHSEVSVLWLLGFARYSTQCYQVREADGVPLGSIQ